MKKAKDLEITEIDFAVPEKYWPEWYVKGLVPTPISEERLNDSADYIREQMTNSKNLENPGDLKKYSANVTIIDDETKVPEIKKAFHMQSPEDSMWFDDTNMKIANIDPTIVIDNNDVIDWDKINNPVRPVKSETSSINSIKKNLLKKKQIKDTILERVAKPGEYIIMLFNKVVQISNLEQTKETVENIILENEFETDDDLIVFLRVPLEKVVK